MSLNRRGGRWRECNIKLFGADGIFKRMITLSDANVITRRDDGHWVCEVCSQSGENSRCLEKRPNHQFVVCQREPERSRQCDPAAITASEMKVLAGVPPGHGLDFITEGRRQAVALKVKMWGESSPRHRLPIYSNQPNQYIPPDAEELGVKEVGAP